MSKARSVGRQTSFNRQSGRPVAWGFWLANALVSPDRIRLTYSDCYYIVFIFSICPYMNIFRFVFKGLREKMGLERCRLCVSHTSTSYLCIHVSWSQVPFNAAPSPPPLSPLPPPSPSPPSLPSPPPLPPSLYTQGSAAAPIARSVLEFFLDFDIPIYELYGMSESTGPQTLSLIGQCSHVTRTVVVQHTMSPLHTHTDCCVYMYMYMYIRM